MNLKFWQKKELPNETLEKDWKLLKMAADNLTKAYAQLQGQTQIFNVGKQTPTLPHSFLIELSDRSWVLQRVINAIVREVLSLGWLIEPEFTYKCESCESTYKKPQKENKCPKCSKELSEPNQTEKSKIEAILKAPNQKESFRELLKGILLYDLTVDDWYLEIAWDWTQVPELGLNGRGEPSKIGILDPRTVKPVLDEFGNLGNNEWFCPYCRAKDISEGNRKKHIQVWKGRRKTCPTCGGKLEKTCYIQEIEGKIVNRWTEYQVVHGARRRRPPEIFGRPLMISLLEAIQTIEAMDYQNLVAAESGETGKLIFLPGYSETTVDSIYQQIEKRIQAVGKAIRNFFVGVPQSETQPFVIDATKTSRETQALEWYEKYEKVITTTYSVQIKWVGFETPGRLGHFDVDVQVQEPAIMEICTYIEEVFNAIFRKYYKIEDFSFKFGEFRQEDEEKKWNVELTKANVIGAYHAIGYDAEIDEDDNLVIKKRETAWASDPFQKATFNIKRLGWMTKIPKLATFPKSFERIFWEIISEGVERNLSMYDIQVHMEEALPWEASVEEIDNIKRIVRNEVMRIRNIENVTNFEHIEKEKEEEYRYVFAGRPPSHPKCCEMCAKIINEVNRLGKGKGLPLQDLKKLIAQISTEYKGGGDWSRPHVNCTHWIQRKVVI